MARNLWSDRPLGVKLASLVGAGAVALAVFATVTVMALQEAGERTDVLLSTTHATAEGLEADMIHDRAGDDPSQEGEDGSTTRAMGDSQAAIDEVARMATSLQSSVAKFLY